ncbi:MAG: substrate-binding domain-containing protein [Opitutales bacterium]
MHRLHPALLYFLLLVPLAGQNREILAELKIGIIGESQEAAIYQAAHLGAQDAARELSEKYSIDVELIVATPNLTRGENQSTALAELYLEGADGLMISPNPDDFTVSSLEFAAENGMEILYFERELPSPRPLAAVLPDERAAGRLAGEAMRKALPKGARAAILTAETPEPQLQARLEAVRATLGYRRIETVVHSNPSYRGAMRRIAEAEADDHDQLIKGWVFLEDWPLQGMPTLPWKPGSKPVVAIQSSPSAFVYSEQGYLNALVVHAYYQWGYRGVEILVEKIYRDQPPADRRILTEPELIDWRNFDAYRENWKVWFK